MSQQPEALRLADAWDAAISTRRHVAIGCEMAEELRRLHAENEALKSAVAEAVAAERERLCAAIKAADDTAIQADYMLDSDDCIRVIRGTWHHDHA